MLIRHHGDGRWRGARPTLWLLALCVGLAACAPATPEAAVEQSPPPVTAATPSATPVLTPSASGVEAPAALTTRIGELTVAAEMPRVGYDRDLFDHWMDLDGDCQDTRHEVLVAESRTEVSGCRIEAGEWLSYYDALAWTVSSDVDVDHMVPLGEAWDSGAGRWSPDTRRRFANDLDDDRSLVAVTDNANQSKGDRDPAEWLPDQDVCRYAVDWVVVKTRWSLTVDEPERDALLAIANDCPDQLIALRVATVEMGPPPATELDVEPADCVDVNREADLAELERIVHIGLERADDVIAHRPYESLEQLQRIDGVGPARVQDIREQGLATIAC